jgi:multidrug efflux pump subunit AcrA (membrane-fusion protein)
MRFLGHSLFGLLVLALTLGLLGLAANTLRQALLPDPEGEEDTPAARERVFTANVVPARATAAQPVMTVYGQIRALRTLELRAPAGGRLAELSASFVDGGTVQAGDVLLRLDDADARAARDIARAGLAEAEAGVRDAARAVDLAQQDLAAAEVQADLRRQSLTRAQDIRSRGAGSDAAVEDAALALSSAEQAVLARRQALAQAESARDLSATTLDRARIALDESERALQDTVLRAAFGGVLNGVTVVPGGILSANERLADLIDPAALEVSARVSTAQYARLVGQDGTVQPLAVTVSLDVGGAVIAATGRLTRAAAAVGEGQTGRQVFAALDAPAGFRPGDFVTLSIAEPVLPDAVVLPASALGADGGVLALGQDDRLELLPATLLRREGDRVILAATGLAGRDVVRERSPLLGAGIKVKPVREAQGNSAAAARPDLIELTPERRAALIALVERNTRMPPEAKARVLAQLSQDRVPARVVERLESRGGG